MLGKSCPKCKMQQNLITLSDANLTVNTKIKKRATLPNESWRRSQMLLKFNLIYNSYWAFFFIPNLAPTLKWLGVRANCQYTCWSQGGPMILLERCSRCILFLQLLHWFFFWAIGEETEYISDVEPREVSGTPKMDCSITTCLTWLTIGFVGLAIVFRIFRKRIFAAFCSNMSKGPMLRAEKKKLFQPLNEAAQKAGPGKLKVNL